MQQFDHCTDEGFNEAPAIAEPQTVALSSCCTVFTATASFE